MTTASLYTQLHVRKQNKPYGVSVSACSATSPTRVPLELGGTEFVPGDRV